MKTVSTDKNVVNRQNKLLKQQVFGFLLIFTISIRFISIPKKRAYTSAATVLYVKVAIWRTAAGCRLEGLHSLSKIWRYRGIAKMYKGKGKLVLVVVLALMMVVTACSGGKKEETSSPSATPSATASTDASKEPEAAKPSYYQEKPATVSMLMRDTEAWPYKKDWPIWSWFKEATNISVDVTIPAGDFAEALQLAVASGALQDIIPNLSYGWANQFGQQGALMELGQYMDKMPNVKKFYEANKPLFDTWRDANGSMYMIPSNGSNLTDYMVYFYREDAFTKNNLKVPTTFDELYETAKQLKQLYPDSYPISFTSFGRIGFFANSFDTYNNFYFDRDAGQAVYGPSEDKFKELVVYLRKFYAEGLIPPNFMSMKSDEWRQKMLTDKSFITFSYIGQIEITNSMTEGQGNWEYMSPPSSAVSKGYIPNNNRSTSGFSVSSQTKNLDAALAYIDFLYSDEGSDLASWGKAGETYDVAGDKRTFKSEYTQFTDLRKNVGIMTSPTFLRFDSEALLAMIPETEVEAYRKVEEDKLPDFIDNTPTMTTEEQESVKQYVDSIGTYYEENVAKFILGEKPMEDWAKYVEGYKSYNMDKVLEVYTKAYKKMYSL